MVEPATQPQPEQRTTSPELDSRDFPGCRPVHIPPDELDSYEGRYEYWEASTGTAMVLAEPESLYHNVPASSLGALAREIALARGSSILALGGVDLVWRNDRGEREVVLQADHLLYLNRPWPDTTYIEVNAGRLPDVILEVDHTTDARPRKLGVYESWGCPEVWVDVPQPSWLAPRGPRRPSLTIHVLQGGEFRDSTSSRAFPGWTAEEIHRALHEGERSPETATTLRRVGRVLGTAAGTVPDDDPFMASAMDEGRLDMLRTSVSQIFAARGVPITPLLEDFMLGLRDPSAAPALITAATCCRDADDFLCRAGAIPQ